MSDFSALFSDPERVPDEVLEEFFDERIVPAIDFLYGEPFAQSKPGDKVTFCLGKGAVKLYIEACCYIDEELDDDDQPTGEPVVAREVVIFASLEKSDAERDAARSAFIEKHRDQDGFDEERFVQATQLNQSRLWETVKLVFDYDEAEMLSAERFTHLEDDDEDVITALKDTRAERSEYEVFSDELPVLEGAHMRLGSHLRTC